jgi:hypothetical protein
MRPASAVPVFPLRITLTGTVIIDSAATSAAGITTHPDHSNSTAYRDYLRTRFRRELHAQSSLDTEVYRAVVRSVRRELVASGLWDLADVREYWHSRIPIA